MNVLELMKSGRELLYMLAEMSNSIMIFFTTPLKDLQEHLEFPGMLNNILDLIFGALPIGNYTPLSLMFGSGVIIIILVAIKNFIV